MKRALLRKDPNFSEESFGDNGFLQFCKAAAARDHVTLEWDDKYDDQVVRTP